MKFKDYLNEDESLVISALDEIPNNNLLTEAGLSRLLDKVKNDDFAVITAYRSQYDKNENIKRNRKLRTVLNKNKIGPYQLIGHWRECQLDDVDYEDCPENQLVDVIERSYLVVRSSNMTQDNFKNFIQEQVKKFDQDGAVISLDGVIYIIESTGKLDTIGSGVTLNKISQAYSQFIKKQNVPFVFEAEVPSSIISRKMFSANGIKYPKNYTMNETRLFV